MLVAFVDIGISILNGAKSNRNIYFQILIDFEDTLLQQLMDLIFIDFSVIPSKYNNQTPLKLLKRTGFPLRPRISWQILSAENDK